MNVRRFLGRNAREAMAQVRAAWGEQAVVLSNRPVPGGVEILAMPGAEVAATPAASAAPAAAPTADGEGSTPMSTVSFQDFVRERQKQPVRAAAPAAEPPRDSFERKAPREPGRFASQALSLELARREPAPADLLSELREMRKLLSGQLSGMNWFDSVRRDPGQTQLLRLMIGNGFSPQLARGIVGHLPAGREGTDASQWLLDVLTRNVHCAQGEDALMERGGVYALVGPTGVGKTTTTAKIAANFARRHGSASVGLVTADTYRMAAGDQLAAFGRLLDIPVHTAHNAPALAELLQLLSGKKLVLVDTVGLAQRDPRVGEVLAALPARSIRPLLVLNAAAQAGTLEEAVRAWGAAPGSPCVISKLDEATSAAGAIDVVIRHKLTVLGVANGQRVPEDWHAPRAQLLAQKALLKPSGAAHALEDAELGLLLTASADGVSQGASHA